jgi:ketosteroid isomerase-like protein
MDSGSLAYDKDFDVQETDFRAFDDLVILVGIMLGHSRLDGEQQVFHFRCISVWRRHADDWRMVAWQSSSSSLAGY